MYNNFISSELTSYPFISSYTFRLIADHGLLSSGDYSNCRGDIKSLKNGINPNAVKEKDIVYVVTEHIDQHFRNMHPKIQNPYILVTSRCDRGVDKESVKYIDEKIIKWFSSNVEVEHPKLQGIPLGLQNRHWKIFDHPQSDISLLLEIIGEKITKKENDVLLSFQIHTNPKHREECYNYFKNKSFVKKRQYGQKDRTDKMFVSEYFREIRKSKFVVCPFGGGFDCHRNWEVFSLGSFPIIKKHKSMEPFYDMPAWFVDDWSEVESSKIDDKYNELNEGKYNFEKIFFKYWMDEILKVKNS